MLTVSFTFSYVYVIICSAYMAKCTNELQRNDLSAPGRSLLDNPFFSNITIKRHSRDTSQKQRHHHHSHLKSCGKGAVDTQPGMPIRYFSEKLVEDIIQEFAMRERSIGYHIDEFVGCIHRGHTLIQEAFKSWQSTPPLLQTYVSNVTSILNNLRLLSSSILRHMETINRLGVSRGDIKLTLRKGASASKTSSRKRRHLHGHDSYHHVTHNYSVRKKRSASTGYENNFWLPFEKAISYLNATNAWYIFLQELSSVLGSYEMQKPDKPVEEGQFSGWESRINISKGNLKDALERILEEYGLNSLKDSVIPLLISTANLQRLTYLNEIIKATLLTPTVCSHTSKYVFVVGSYVSLNSIVKCINSQVRGVVAVAANIVFIDLNLDSVSINKGNNFNLTIIAPYWQIVGENRVMNISAPAGKAKARSSGEPGSPGGNGGSFYGVAHNISNNGSKLQLITSGGEGGPGHAGGFEKPGKTVEEECYFECKSRCAPDDACFCSECDYFCCSATTNFVYNGKDGGKAGIGGYSGCVELVSTMEVSLEEIIIVERNAGKNGSIGPDGKGKTATAPPPQIELDEVGILRINGIKNAYCAGNGSEAISANPSAKDGEDGKDPRPPQPPVSAETDLRSVVMGSRKFKAIVLTSSHIFSRPGILSVIRYLDNNSTIQAEYKTTDFLGEYFDLQEQSSYISRHVLPELYYSSVSKRSLSRVVDNITEEDDELRLLSFLYSAALAKKLAITHGFQPDTKSDIYGFLYFEEEVLTEMIAGASNENLLEQFELSRRYLQFYEDHFKEIFQQAVLFSEDFVLTEIRLTEKNFKNVTVRLLKDIKNYKGDGNQAGLEEARRKLLAHTVRNSLFVAVKLAAISFSFWNPVGAAIVSGANLSYCMKNYGSASAKTKGWRANEVDIPQFVLDANSRVAYRIRKATAYSFRGLVGDLNAAYKLLSAFPEDFKEALAEIKRVNGTASVMAMESTNSTDQFPPQNNVHAFKVLLTGLTFVKGAQKNLTSLLDSKMSGGGNKNQQDAARLAYGIFSIDSQFFNQLGSDKDNIMEAAEQILMALGEVSTLAEHSERLQAEMIPDMNNLLSELGNIMNDRLSQAILTIRWRMQSTILDTKVYLEQIFSHKNESDLRVENALKMLDEATTSFVRFYEHLQDNHDQTVVYNFVITALGNNGAYFKASNNSTIEEATQALRYNLLGQLVVKRHQRVSGLFRYWKFPAVTAELCITLLYFQANRI